MNPFLKTEYFTAFYHFFKDNYEFLLQPHSYRSNSLVYLAHKDTPPFKSNAKIIHSEKEFVNIFSQANFSLFFLEHQGRKIDKEEKFRFFIEYGNNHEQKKKDLLKFFNNITFHHLYNEYKIIFPALFKDKQQLTGAILNLSNKEFNLYSKDSFTELDQFLQKEYSLTKHEIDTFWLKFFKNKPKMLQNMNYINHVKSFLLERYHYSDDILKQYIDILPSIKSDLLSLTDEEKHSIFIKKKKYDISSSVDLLQTVKIFGIQCFSIENFTTHFENFVKIYAKYNDVKDVSLVNKNKIIKIFMSHNNDSFTEDILNNTIIDYCSFLKNNPNFVSSEENINKWLFNKNLEKNIEEKSNHVRRNKL